MFRNYIKQCNGQVESVKRIVKKRDMSYPVSKFVLSSHSEHSAVMPSISGDGDSPDHLTTVTICCKCLGSFAFL